MWDVLSWHDGTLSIAWWVVLVLIVFLLGIAGHGGEHWHKHLLGVVQSLFGVAQARGGASLPLLRGCNRCCERACLEGARNPYFPVLKFVCPSGKIIERRARNASRLSLIQGATEEPETARPGFLGRGDESVTGSTHYFCPDEDRGSASLFFGTIGGAASG